MRGYGPDPSRTADDFRVGDSLALIDACKASLEAAVLLTAGWSRRRLLDVALTLAAGKHPRPGHDRPWGDQELRAAHTAHGNGVRTPWAVEGERLYQQAAYRRRSAS